ncbi:MAG: hypothetical protein FWG40_03330 [Peptococcaceae bacterium]|nr:hypothetical protein [Peptococcaceae bacterium]
MNDPRPKIREAAREAHKVKFPHYEHNMTKKGLTAFLLELFIHSNIRHEQGDNVTVNMLMTMDDTGLVRRIDHDKSADESKTEVTCIEEIKNDMRFHKS